MSDGGPSNFHAHDNFDMNVYVWYTFWLFYTSDTFPYEYLCPM